MLEQRRATIDLQKKELQKKYKKITELESKHELALQNKDKEISTLQNDIKANQDIVKETMAQFRAKQQSHQIQQ